MASPLAKQGMGGDTRLYGKWNRTGTCPHCGAPVSADDDVTVAVARPSTEETIADTSRPAPPRSEEQGGQGDEATRLFARYEILGELGRGGMGIVYRARDTKLGRIVALKVLIAGEDASHDEVERFFREAEASARLRHPNIIPIHELDVFEGKHYFTMDHVEGTPLDKLVAAGDMDPFRAMRFMEKIARAVHAAHAEGIVHRDLKHSNVIVRADGEPLVMDFGLAKQLKADSSLTQSGVFMGTPSYASPEQAEGRAREVDARSDVFSLGSMLYEMLTGRVPFLGGSAFAILREITDTEPVPLRKVDRRVPRDAGVICLKCLEKPPERRYQSAEELADDCRRFLAGEAIHARPASILYRARKRLARHKGLVMASALALVMISGLAAWLLPRLLAEREARERAESEKVALEEQAAAEAAREWHLVFEDDFSDPDVEERWEIIGGEGQLEWEVKDGELRVRGGKPQLVILNQPVAGDVRLEFDCHQESEYVNDVSCILSAIRQNTAGDTAHSGYQVKYGGFDNTRIQLISRVAALWEEMASPLVKGKVYRARAERVGSRLTLTVNGEVIFDVEDAEPLTGPDRTCVALFGWLADTYYDNVKVYTLGASRKVDMLELAEEYHGQGRYAFAARLFRDVADASADPGRKARAEAGLERAERMARLAEQLPQWRSALEAAWPGARFEMALADDGLVLDCSGAGIASLEPLRGTPLVRLDCSWNRVADLEPLRGMPLTGLDCAENRIESLEPLRGLPLTILECGGNRIASLEPLRGLPLTGLDCAGNRIESLEPLRGMPLTRLGCLANRIRDLGPVRGMPLGSLQCCGNPVRSLEPLRGMQIKELFCSGTGLTSLDPLRGVPLRVLHCRLNRITSLEPLSGMALRELACTGNQIDDLGPLHGMPLTVLECGQNRIRSLEPLRGMPLKKLVCGKNLVRDLDALHDMPLLDLRCARNDIRDLNPLAGMSLTSVWVHDNPLVSLDPFVQQPPKAFFFESDHLPEKELERAINVWTRDPRHARHARNTAVLLALRRGDMAGLRSAAVERDGHHYAYVPRLVTWREAETVAERFGGHLVTVTDEGESDFIIALADENETGLWLGLTDGDGTGQWRWVTGEKMGFTMWGPRRPDETQGRYGILACWPRRHWYNTDERRLEVFVIEWDD